MKENSLEFPVKETIQKRTSVRTHKPVPLPEEVEGKLKNYAKEIKGPFSPKVRFAFIKENSFLEESGGRISTYGVIRDPKNYLGALVEKGLDKNLEQVGYVLEELILYATDLGLGTCWLGGTFKIKGLEKAVGMEKGEILPVITPLGYPGKGKRLIERALKAAAGSKKRKPWHKLFFTGSLNSPISEKEAGSYQNPLEMVRLAPSASNRQPWRLVQEGSSWHFFMDPSKIVNQAVGYPIQRVDMGIAMCHFELTALEEGLRGKWITLKEKPDLEGAEKLHYIASWLAE